MDYGVQVLMEGRSVRSVVSDLSSSSELLAWAARKMLRSHLLNQHLKTSYIGTKVCSFVMPQERVSCLCSLQSLNGWPLQAPRLYIVL
ncbi:hypothetical protein MPTK1_1g05840 [Marchantia polymorpha subsp. ruderalis]|uniref:Uncharacterized protein n=2 Tax=Marchantia polymorpha TaxID=3197 RepID=A0AAF6ALY2_MARPO|nr:hypothetical protein MARPO_0005s0024 [Marchantia polymorpha]BBM97452.1 hypothetical protein Mp_1g05840 [Marchantia polymorpha subsp. ruderalis]|eukprot:PTQ48352.1 hypothetical protein MARPO_0005s0024 [Marchantia polymorpha]